MHVAALGYQKATKTGDLQCLVLPGSSAATAVAGRVLHLPRRDFSHQQGQSCLPLQSAWPGPTVSAGCSPAWQQSHSFCSSWTLLLLQEKKTKNKQQPFNSIY